MKVIFFDIDGVLNTSETYSRLYKRYGYAGISDIEIDEFRLEYLKSIIDKTEAKLVLTSTFRRFFMKENDKIIPINLKGRKIFDKFSNYDIEIYDITPVNDFTREEQIKQWISLTGDIDNFVIIDDDPNMFYELKENLIQTSRSRRNSLLMNFDDSFGLCERHIKEVVHSLNNKTKVLKK